jgi:sugar phosphate isomerase/epimerase
VRFAIEPINRYETDLLNDVQSGLRFLERLGQDNVGLLLDTFHMNIEERNLIESIRLARTRLFHFHVADSNRWYPGAGHIDFRSVLATLDDIDYSGFVSAEILPMPDPDSAAKNTIESLRKFR